ncbi:MAG: hypothetical protein AAGN35_06595 [Bacteroidota bacterium]
MLTAPTTSQAQSFGPTASSCEGKCAPSTSALGMLDFSCNRKVFTVNTSRKSPCIIVDYDWTVSGGPHSIIDAGSQALITFNANGTFTVCVEFIVADDANGNGVADPGEAQCSSTSCKTIDINC